MGNRSSRERREGGYPAKSSVPIDCKLNSRDVPAHKLNRGTVRSDARAKSDVARNYRIPGTAAFMISLDSLKGEHLSYHRADALMDDGLAPSEQVARQTEDVRSIRTRGTTG